MEVFEDIELRPTCRRLWGHYKLDKFYPKSQEQVEEAKHSKYDEKKTFFAH